MDARKISFGQRWIIFLPSIFLPWICSDFQHYPARVRSSPGEHFTSASVQPSMKRLLAFSVLLILCGLVSPAPQARADGFIIVDETHWWPGPRPPHPIPPPWPPPQPWPPRPI